MKTTFHPRAGVQASVLMIALIVGAILLTTLISYLSLLNNQNLSVARSQAWNDALVLAEAGVEEALAQLNGGVGPNPLGGKQWSLNGGFYTPNSGARALIGGTYTVKYTTTSPPIIYATGFATAPTIPGSIRRAVEVKTATRPLWNVGVVSRKNITLNGNNISTDSYDSQLTGGLYPTNNSSLIGNEGDIASAYGIISVGNANINGKVFLGPTASWSVGPNGYVSGDIVHDFNMDFPDVLAPDWIPSAFQYQPTYTNNVATITGPGGTSGTNQYVVNGALSMQNNKTIRVVGNVDLYVAGNVVAGTIEITEGAHLRLFVAGSSAKFGHFIYGSGMSAGAFQYFGLPSNTSITLIGNESFIGAIYAPNADFSASGGGSNSIDIQGAMVVNTITMNGNFKLHYDKNLRITGPPGLYSAISWKEISP